MKRKHWIFIALIFLIVVPIAVFSSDEAEGPVSYSVDDAIAVALANSRDIQNAELAIETETINLRDARKMVDDAEDNKRFMVTLEQKYVLRGYYKRLAEMSLTLAEKQKDLMEILTAFQAKSDYYSLKNAERDVALKAANAERTAQLLDLAKTKFALGTISKQELLSAEVNANSASLQEDTARNSLAYSKMTLNKTLSLPLESELVLTDELTFEPYGEVDLQEKEALALENRLDVIGAREAYEAALKKFEITAAVYTPNVYIYKKAELEKEDAYNELVNKETDAIIAVNKAYIDLKNAEKSVLIMAGNVSLMEESYRLSLLSYEYGLGTYLDAEAAQDKLAETELAYNQALLGYELAVLSFEASYSIGLN